MIIIPIKIKIPYKYLKNKSNRKFYKMGMSKIRFKGVIQEQCNSAMRIKISNIQIQIPK